MSNVLDFSKKYGELTIISFGEKRSSDGKNMYTCKCSCGNITYSTRYNLLKGYKTRCEECTKQRLIEMNTNRSLIGEEDTIGKIYNHLKVLRLSEIKNKYGRSQYVCQCTICGRDDVLAMKSDLVHGRKKACTDCSKKLSAESRKAITDSLMVGKKIDHLTVIERVPTDRKASHGSKWLCRCDCGNEVIKYKDELDKTNRSYPLCCPDCIPTRTVKEDRIVRDIIVNIYRTIYRSCYDNTHKAFHLYGANGVGICTEWLMNKEKFVEWCLNNGFDTDMTVNLIDKTKDFSPENCEIITKEDGLYEKIGSRRTSDGYSVMRLCKDNGFDYDLVCRTIRNWNELSKEQLYYRVVNDPLLFQKN